MPELFRSAELIDIQAHVQDEIVVRGDPDFAERSALWSETMQSVGVHFTGAGYCTQAKLRQALECYKAWVQDGVGEANALDANRYRRSGVAVELPKSRGNPAFGMSLDNASAIDNG